MVRKKDVDFYSGFSRKELQSLCKKYNLPANRSSSDMAESLASYFEVVILFLLLLLLAIQFLYRQKLYLV